MRFDWKQLLRFFIVLALASAVCLALYKFDNKYTHPGAQPIDGLLVLSRDELENEVHFLIHGWAFYPGALLTPGELADGGAEHYMVYTSIGERTRLGAGGSGDPRGCGTYALTLRLPDEPDSYAIELPEVYSACKLYIDGELKLQTGEPELDAYQPRTQRRLVLFEGGGTVSILLAVSNYSHFYGGLVYPPAFGTPRDVNLTFGMRLTLAACVSIIGILGVFLSGYLGIRMKQQNALLFSMLCLAATLFISYPVVNTVLMLPVHPWYAIETASGYAAILLVIVLQNSLCSVEGLARRVSETAGAVFCAVALCYGLFSAHLSVTVIELFSAAAALFKLGAAAYLIAVSFIAMRRHIARAVPLFYASAFYAALLVWDRLLPAYEPILSGWFAEIGSIVMIFVIGYSLWRDIVIAYSYNMAFAEEHRQTKRQLAMQMEYANQLAARSSENRKLVHDFRHHLRAIQEMAQLVVSSPETEERQNELLAYLGAFMQSASFKPGAAPNALCNHAAVDALLQYFDASALKQGVESKLALTIPEGLPLSDIEWCSVLGNLLENALEGCERSNEERRILNISTKWTGRTFFLLVENTYDGVYHRTSGRFLSRKRECGGFGVGMESVKETVERHGGTMQIYALEKVFRVGVTIAGGESK